jgi:uncharacterized protein YjbI with pentapeptide repeats
LSYAYLAEANLQRPFSTLPIYSRANLTRTDFTEAELFDSTVFGEAYMEETLFIRAVLQGADMGDVIFTSADFSDAVLCVRTAALWRLSLSVC